MLGMIPLYVGGGLMWEPMAILIGVSVGLVTLSLIGAQTLKNRERRYVERIEKRKED